MAVRNKNMGFFLDTHVFIYHLEKYTMKNQIKKQSSEELFSDISSHLFYGWLFLICTSLASVITLFFYLFGSVYMMFWSVICGVINFTISLTFFLSHEILINRLEIREESLKVQNEIKKIKNR